MAKDTTYFLSDNWESSPLRNLHLTYRSLEDSGTQSLRNLCTHRYIYRDKSGRDCWCDRKTSDIRTSKICTILDGKYRTTTSPNAQANSIASEYCSLYYMEILQKNVTKANENFRWSVIYCSASYANQCSYDTWKQPWSISIQSRYVSKRSIIKRLACYNSHEKTTCKLPTMQAMLSVEDTTIINQQVWKPNKIRHSHEWPLQGKARSCERHFNHDTTPRNYGAN